MPNHTIKMTAKPRNMWFPIDSNIAACWVIRSERNAKRSFIELGGIGFSLVALPAGRQARRSLRHPPGEHRGGGICCLGGHRGLTLRPATGVVVGRLRLGVAV